MLICSKNENLKFLGLLATLVMHKCFEKGRFYRSQTNQNYQYLDKYLKGSILATFALIEPKTCLKHSYIAGLKQTKWFYRAI